MTSTLDLAGLAQSLANGALSVEKSAGEAARLGRESVLGLEAQLEALSASRADTTPDSMIWWAQTLVVFEVLRASGRTHEAVWAASPVSSVLCPADAGLIGERLLLFVLEMIGVHMPPEMRCGLRMNCGLFLMKYPHVTPSLFDRAIEHYRSARADCTGCMDSRVAGDLLRNLGKALVDRGRKADSPEAIDALRSAVQSFARAGNLYAEGLAAHDLGLALWTDSGETRSDRIEEAIVALKRAQELHPKARHPREWGMASSKLVLCFKARVAGDRRANIDAALGLLEQLCTVHTRESDPADWAHHQHERTLLLEARSKLT